MQHLFELNVISKIPIDTLSKFVFHTDKLRYKTQMGRRWKVIVGKLVDSMFRFSVYVLVRAALLPADDTQRLPGPLEQAWECALFLRLGQGTRLHTRGLYMMDTEKKMYIIWVQGHTHTIVLRASCIFPVSGGWGKREREKYVWTLLTALHAICRNVGGSNLIGPFRSSTWLLYSSKWKSHDVQD